MALHRGVADRELRGDLRVRPPLRQPQRVRLPPGEPCPPRGGGALVPGCLAAGRLYSLRVARVSRSRASNSASLIICSCAGVSLATGTEQLMASRAGVR